MNNPKPITQNSEQFLPEPNPFFEPPKPKKDSKVIRILQPVAIFCIIALMFWIIVFGQSQVDGPSMEPNFFTGEFLLYTKVQNILPPTPFLRALSLSYNRGDVVILRLPTENRDFVKRVVGLPGESVAIEDGKVFVNGKIISEDYLGPTISTRAGDFIEEGEGPQTAPEGTYIVFGDNRPVSADSRFSWVGFVKKEWIKGRVFIRIWPANTFGFIGTGTSRFIEN